MELQDVEQRYCTRVIEDFERLTFQGIARSGRAVSLKLEDVYVELKAVADVPDAADAYNADERRLLLEAEARGMSEGDLRRQLDSLRVERWREEARRAGSQLVRRSIEETVVDPTRPGIIILGDPGSGKSTLLKYLALRAARQESGAVEKGKSLVLKTAKGAPLLPIFVPLAAYDDWLRREAHGHMSLAEFLPVYHETWCNRPGLAPLFRRALDEGRALVLLDGLDEVLDVTTRQHIAMQVNVLIQAEVARGNRFAVTSRVVGYREAPLPGDLPHVTVLDFGEPEIATFARRWCQACEVWLAGEQLTEKTIQQAAREEKALLDEVKANPSVLRLAANPLLLTMLALLRRQGGKLPEERVKLYQRYTEMLLDSGWENARSEGARTKGIKRFDQNLATSYLMELALWLQRFKPSGTARKSDLLAALVEVGLKEEGLDPVSVSPKERREARGKAEQFVQEMRHFAGLLAERGQDAYGFLHLTFQEYFAGRALARMGGEERWAVLKEHLHQPRWREPLLLCAGQLGIVEKRTREMGELGRGILAAGSAHEAILHRDVLLATAMVTDGVGVDRGLQDELVTRLKLLADDPVPALRQEALRGLARLAQFGHERAAEWLEARISQRAGNLEELAPAVALAIAAESCTGIRKALTAWVKNFETIHFALDVLIPQMFDDGEVRDLLFGLLDDPNGYMRQAAVRALGVLVASDEGVLGRIVEKLNDDSATVRRAAVHALASLASSDDNVRGLVRRRLEDTDKYVQLTAMEALASSDKGARDRVVRGLQAEDLFVRHSATAAAEDLRANDREIHDLILGQFDDPDPNVRRVAVDIIGSTVSSERDTREAVIGKLTDVDDAVRTTTVKALGSLVASDAEVRVHVLGMLDDRCGGVRAAAVEVLKSLVSSDRDVRARVLGKLHDYSWDIQPSAIESLTDLVARDMTMRDLTLGKLGNPDRSVRRAAALALRPLMSTDPEVLDLVLEKLDDPDYRVRCGVLLALRSVIASDDVLTLVLDRLDDPDDNVQMTAVALLGSVVLSDTRVRDRILRMADLGMELQPTVMKALAPLMARDKAIRELVFGRLDASDPHTRSIAVSALESLVATDKGVRDLVVGKLTDSDYTVRRAAIEALEPLAATDREVRDLLLGRFRDHDMYARSTAIQSLSSLIVSDREVRERVLGESHDPFTRRAAIRILRPLVTSDDKAREFVLGGLDDPNHEVRSTAVRVLGSLVLNDKGVRDRVLGMLDDDSGAVRQQVAATVAPLLAEDQGLREQLLDWLGMVSEPDSRRADVSRRRLAEAYARHLEVDPVLLSRIVGMLRSPNWFRRKGAAWALLAMPHGPPDEVLPLLRGLADDSRAEESWVIRLHTAAPLINDRDLEVRRQAIAVAMQALEYATKPWYDLPSTGTEVRAHAAKILGSLEPEYRSEEIFARLSRLLQDDLREDVRDAAYFALLRLAVAPEAEHDVESLLCSVDVRQPAPTPTAALSMRPLPRSFVLHLSDLHFGTRQNADIWYSQLAEDLQLELSSDISAVIVSGDLANKSTPEEYDAALYFLERLRGEFGLSAAQMIPVPGNHDLNWVLAEDAYRLVKRRDYPGDLEEGRFKDIGSGAILVRDEALYPQRFEHFATFYRALRGERYPLDPEQQGLLYPLSAQRLLMLGLNSAWNLDHLFRDRASIHPQALGHALDRVRGEPGYRDFLKIAVWHHPVHSGFPDRITDPGFLEQLAKADFRLGLHGHIHKAQNNLFRYDMGPAGRRLELVCAGTFGAPTRELVPGYPFQYQLLRVEGTSVTVETRRREEVHGAWRPDARWITERGKDPVPRYTLQLF